MYIFRWLMKHPIIILALYFLSIAAILYSMTGGNSSDKNIDGSLVKKGSVSNYFKKHGVDLSNAPTIEPSTLTTTLVNEDSSEETTDTTFTEDTKTDESKISEPSENELEAPSTPPTDEVAAEPTSPADETAVELTAKTEEAQPDTQFSEMSAEELLLMAREAYWNNGLEESAQIYQQLIEMNPNVIDYKGELGNVYWRQGFPKKAAELYAEISLPMIEEGNADRVANMVGFIGLFFPEKATEIHNVLQVDK